MKEENENKKADFFIGLLAIVAVLFLIWGATACKKIQYVQGETIYKEVKVIEHDSTLVWEPDTASINALLHCDSAYNVIMDELAAENGARLEAEAKLRRKTGDNGVKYAEIAFECREDSLFKVIHYQDSIIKEITERNTIITEEHRTPKTENSRFARFCICYFFVSIFMLIATAVLYYVMKHYLRK